MELGYNGLYVSNISTKETKARSRPRLSQAGQNSWGPQNREAPPPKRSHSHRRLNMIPRSRRIPKSSFRYLSAGRSFSHGALSIRCVPLSTSEPSRIAVIVSKKVAKSAVARNKLRRRVYSAFQPMLPRLKEGFLCLAYLRREGEGLSFKDLSSAIEELCRTARIV
jgi:ribonuclease P protein component